MANNTNNNAPATVAPSLTDILSNTGVNINLDKVKTARRNLTKFGAQSLNLHDETAVAAAEMNIALGTADAHIKTACYIAGAMRIAESWKHERDDAGKPYKSENAFLKAVFPGYATSTVTLYSDVGASIYIPAANGEFGDIPELQDMTPSNAKFLLNAVKDVDKRKRLPAALKEARDNNNGKLTQRAITSAVKALKETDANPQGGSKTAGSIADELSGGAQSAIVSKLISFTYNGDENGTGDLTAIVLERDVKDFMSLLLKARDDEKTATAVCETLYNLAKKAK